MSRAPTTHACARLLLALALAAASHPAGADDDVDSALAWYDGFDRDGDAVVTVEEIQRAGSKRFRRADADGDGALDATEYVGGTTDESERERYLARFAAMDDNQDGRVSAAEFDVYAIQVITSGDLDGDGAMTREEFERSLTDDTAAAGAGDRR